MMQLIYTVVLFPLLYLLFWLLSLKNAKIGEGFTLRKNKSWIKPYDTHSRWIWFHVASGELEYAKPVITKIKNMIAEDHQPPTAGFEDSRKFEISPKSTKTSSGNDSTCKEANLESKVATPKNAPEIKILVTFFSPSVLPSLQKAKDIDLFVPMPWDTPWHWNEFLKHYRPLCLAIARTDTWPNMIWQTKKHGIPAILFSATLPKTSARAASFITRLFYGSVIDKLTHVSCVTQDDCDNFRRLDDDLSLSADGDTRFDQVISRIAENRPLMEVVQNLSTTFIVGSSWPEDERVVLPALKKPVLEGLNVVFAPHEPTAEHLTSLERQFATMGIATCRYSTSETNAFTSTSASTSTMKTAPATPATGATAVADLAIGVIGSKNGQPGKVVIVDIVGVLADLYRVGTIAFVGGSFKKSVHSVMEPAAAGCLTLFGPYHFNNREALAMKTKGLALEVGSSEEIETLLLNELKLRHESKLSSTPAPTPQAPLAATPGSPFAQNTAPNLLHERTEKILAFVNSNKGVSEKVARWILNHLKT